MQKLLFVSSYSGLGGGETIQLNLIRGLDRSRYEVRLACPREGQMLAAARDLGVTTHVIRYRGVTVWFVPALWKRLPPARKIADLARAHGIDAIHTDYHSLPFAVAAGQANGIPVIWNAMGWWYPVRPWQRRFFREEVAQIVTISRAIRDRWLGDRPFMPPERVLPIIPGVDPAQFDPDAVDGSAVRAKLEIDRETPLVGLLARFQRVKGHDIFQAMARRVHEAVPEARFVVAGDNVFGVSKDEAYKRRILETARTDPVLRETLRYIGFWDAPELLAAVDVLVCPSRFESLGMVHLESMAMARPVVSMNNGGPAETVVDGVTGYLVPPEDPDALAERVVTLLRDPALRQRMGAAGRERVLTHYTAAGYAAKFEAVFERVMSDSR